MSDPKSSKRKNNIPGVLFLNVFGIFVTYLVILLFCVKQVLDQPGEHSVEMWMKAILDGVCITTLTYTFTQTINNLALDKKMRAFTLNICVLAADLPYILMYGFWGTKFFGLDIVMCFYTIALVVSTSWSIHLAVKAQESGQDSIHTMIAEEVVQKEATYPKGHSPEE